ncbi:hypothetical protein K493DRAFT_358922 [Basidiobolus meristosporus CBS 931.73]|uniref:Uncharacterized protein n=1 Tax=Basidiobolus meristosporus CBS 931.73 TaxID=1314790 RepID=A0A1Y1XT27_9FUNG|nr:hypothetical protein K493DRAFT_358922 [Basidiobolus meristosporus CBS 931.73]|eukprot:ORX88919.1 hypothetical protein K493DRAFT_358922 [Basidiobolus meristosporus CBS 931.73]
MPRIERIEIRKGLRLKLNVSSEDILDHQAKHSEEDVIYDAKADQKVQRPAAIQNDHQAGLLSIEVSGIPSELVDKKLQLTTDTSAKFYLCGKSQGSSDGTVVFSMEDYKIKGFYSDNPWSFSGMIKFSLHVIGDDGVLGESLYAEDIPMELYLLGYKLPKYFAKGVPLLLLRMFVRAATAQGVATREEWVALVVKICHGSAKPITGEASNTKDHWLKYNVYNGASKFVLPNSDQRKEVHYNNYGGDFRLSAWLEAYRLSVSHGDLSLVNCYDQAAAVEVALSLGIDYNCVAWEYHQKFGFIPRKASLVGWGPCNSPFFKGNIKYQIVEENETTRHYFRNHAFLSWSPDFHPEKEEKFFEKHPDPSKYTKVKMLAIDACAGPHLGDEERGTWIDPATYPDNYADGSTYWKSRDDNYNRDHFDTNTELLDQEDKKNGHPDHHFWTPGITGLDNTSSTSELPYYPLGDPFKGTGIEFADPDSFSQDTRVLVGKISDLQKSFQEYLDQGSNWKPVPIANTKLSDGAIQCVTKLIDSATSALNYFSLQITVTPSVSAALSAFQARAEHLVIVSTLEAEDFESVDVCEKKVRVLHADYTSIMVCLNVVVEVSGHAVKETLKPLADKVAHALAGYQCSMVAEKWLQILD